MVDEMEKATVHHGRNVGAGRYWKNITQDTLAKELGMSQSQISDLEKKENIDKPVLEKIAKCLNVSLDFLETYVPEEAMKAYNIENCDFDNDFNNTLSDQAIETENVGNVINNNQTIDNGISFNAVQELYKELRKQDRRIAELHILLTKNNIDFSPFEN